MAGKRYSRQRELIHQALKGTKRHPTAEMIYKELKQDNPSLSLGTVYRNLNLLTEEGVILRLPFPVERYDACTDPHLHFRCDCCGEVYDVDFPYDTQLDAQVSAVSGHHVVRHEVVFQGVCSNCTVKQ